MVAEMAVIEEWGLKKGGGGGVCQGLFLRHRHKPGFIPHFIHTEMVIRFLMPSGHPPLLSTVLAPG